ncbi:LysR family transcriptional regulator [Amnibacterium kyonggiense]|uniref:DNA-binding transcriptional LysR family regulator n=1 Tax=Amnibacterium kyonggiense TaxID=595671 RepID=A0A4R7FMH6_9MICO|nr:LysR family transcriptional regulator [Amnibacterium kyonggiense]TDS77538.1 DNA-binding transcriptional LysR family regulator [Amnibacterium kyonggiense]
MTLIQLRVFLAAARLGSFTAAAVAMHMAQPSVSELIRRIEETYGARLFVRGGRRLVLTAAGETLLPLAEQTVAGADEADRSLRSLTSLSGGTASFGLLRNAKYYALEALVARFHALHPDVRLRIVGLNSVEVAAAVASGELEAGLVVLPVDDDGLHVTPLVHDEVLYASIDPAAVAEPVTIQALAERQLVLYDAHYGWRDPTRRQIADRARLAAVRVDPLVEVEQVESALALVAAGVGDTFVSRAVAEAQVHGGPIRFVPFAEPLHDTIALVRRRQTAMSAATVELIRLARSMLEDVGGGAGVLRGPAAEGDPVAGNGRWSVPEDVPAL